MSLLLVSLNFNESKEPRVTNVEPQLTFYAFMCLRAKLSYI